MANMFTHGQASNHWRACTQQNAFTLATTLGQLNLIIFMPFLRQLFCGEMLDLDWSALLVPGLWPFLNVWIQAA